MTTETESHMAVTERFTNALMAGDLEGVLDCYGSGAEIRHNFDDRTVDAVEGVRGLTSFFSSFPGRHATDIRRHAIENGIVQQYMLHLGRNDGRTFTQPICVVFTFGAGKIKRLEEYVDLSRMA